MSFCRIAGHSFTGLVRSVEDGLAAVAEWDAEHGALTAEELQAADAILDRVDTFAG